MMNQKIKKSCEHDLGSSVLEKKILLDLHPIKKHFKKSACIIATIACLGCGGGGGGGGSSPAPIPEPPSSDYVKVTHTAGVQSGEYRVYDQCNDPTLSGIIRDTTNQGYFNVHIPTVKQRFSNLASGAYSIYSTYKEPSTGEFITEEKIAEFLNMTSINQKACSDF